MLTLGVTFLCPSPSPPLPFTHHPSTALPFSTTASWLFLVGGREPATPRTLGSLGEQNSTLNFSSPEPRVLNCQIQKEILTNCSQSAWDSPSFSPCSYKPLSREQTGTTGHLGVALLSYHHCHFLTLAFYHPQIYLKFCLKQNLFFSLSLKEVRITSPHGKYIFLLIIKSK